MFEIFKKKKKVDWKSTADADAEARQVERDLKYKEFNESTTFTEEEKQICDIIVKSDFSKCDFDIFDSYYDESTSMIKYHKIIYNNVKLKYYHCIRKTYVHHFDLYRVDNKHYLKTFNMGRAKIAIIDKLIDDKRKAYIENSITSALNNKSANAGDCPYCGTKNSENKTNCINCGAVIKNNISI